MATQLLDVQEKKEELVARLEELLRKGPSIKLQYPELSTALSDAEAENFPNVIALLNKIVKDVPFLSQHPDLKAALAAAKEAKLLLEEHSGKRLRRKE